MKGIENLRTTKGKTTEGKTRTKRRALYGKQQHGIVADCMKRGFQPQMGEWNKPRNSGGTSMIVTRGKKGLKNVLGRITWGQGKGGELGLKGKKTKHDDQKPKTEGEFEGSSHTIPVLMTRKQEGGKVTLLEGGGKGHHRVFKCPA